MLRTRLLQTLAAAGVVVLALDIYSRVQEQTATHGQPVRPAAAEQPAPPKYDEPPPPPTAAELKARERAKEIEFFKICTLSGQMMRNPEKFKDEEFRVAVIERVQDEFGVTAVDMGDIVRRQPRLGMEGCALWAALGSPGRSNHTASSLGHRYQFVYDKPRRYVYVEVVGGKEKVTGWQD